MLLKNKKAFTLIELIVVITILAILGTIAFISLNGYSKTARDSTRISDLSTMKTSLELFNLSAGKYPETTDPFSITYSGVTIWTQGEFGDSTTNNVDRLDKIPADPLTERKYTYSITKTKQEYQLAGMLESDDVVLNLTEQANAGDIVASAIVTGNYNGMMIKTLTGSNCTILSLPSIVSNQPKETTDLLTIIGANGLVYNGYNNLPTNLETSKFKIIDGFNFNPNNLIAYSDTNECKVLSQESLDGAAARIELVTGLQIAYTGTIIHNEGIIDSVLSAVNTDTIISLGNTLVNNNLGGNIINYTDSFIIGNNTNPGLDISACTGETIGTILYSDGTFDGNTLTCDDNIAVCNGTGTGYIIDACNVGTNIMGLNSDSYGHYFQFGRNDSQENGTWTDGNLLYEKDWKSLGGTDSGSANDWGIFSINETTATYENQNSGAKVLMKGPCSDNYHIPSIKEWFDLYTYGDWGNSIGNKGTNMSNDLKLPMAGIRDWDNLGNDLLNTSIWGNYWSSSPGTHSSSYGNNLTFRSTDIYNYTYSFRASGLSIRCFKD